MTVDQSGPTPVKVSGDAHRMLAVYLRRWSGWSDLTLALAKPDPKVSKYAMSDFARREITADPDELILNPNRVLLNVTPFRLRQEAVLTGVLLHEAAHARFTKWVPRTPEEGKVFRHSDGTSVTAQEMALARICEEPRIEGCMYRDRASVGATDLVWTMRAAAAHLLPMTDVAADPDQAILDLIGSWVLRAGRTHALNAGGHTPYRPIWTRDFEALLRKTLISHFEGMAGCLDPYDAAADAADLLTVMVTDLDLQQGPRMVDRAKELLRLLFPNTDDANMPQMGGGCALDASEDSGDEASGDGASCDGEGAPQEEINGLAEALASVEVAETADATKENRAQRGAAPESAAGGVGTPGGSLGDGWRAPTKSEREEAKKAENFLRDLVNPGESSKTSLTDTPASLVDGAALAAWKAGGMKRDPRFFRRTTRTIQPEPPVKIAVLVDVSGSMDCMQKPSALLSWALASAACDLQNFAGRGVQIESCLIHWGDTVRTIQANGEMLRGIKEFSCVEGTSSMHLALAEVERQIPGFFAEDSNANRLVVQFTDWQLGSSSAAAKPVVQTLLRAGVNMLSIIPDAGGQGKLPSILSGITGQRGRCRVLTYNPAQPSRVWTEAARLLGSR